MCFIDELKHENFPNYKIYRKNKRKKEEDCLKLIECTECENSQPSGCEKNVPPTLAEMKSLMKLLQTVGGLMQL